MARWSITSGALFPIADNAYDVGGSVNRVRSIYAGTSVVTTTLTVAGNVGFYGAAAAAKQTVTGSRSTFGGNAALASLLTALSTLGLITDSSTA